MFSKSQFHPSEPHRWAALAVKLACVWVTLRLKHSVFCIHVVGTLTPRATALSYFPFVKCKSVYFLHGNSRSGFLSGWFSPSRTTRAGVHAPVARRAYISLACPATEKESRYRYTVWWYVGFRGAYRILFRFRAKSRFSCNKYTPPTPAHPHHANPRLYHTRLLSAHKLHSGPP